VAGPMAKKSLKVLQARYPQLQWTITPRRNVAVGVCTGFRVEVFGWGRECNYRACAPVLWHGAGSKLLHMADSDCPEKAVDAVLVELRADWGKCIGAATPLEKGPR